jgi:aspartyl-tRNA(Asn)/glutamyl-tRNA(Gln) amidotransferase subunit A
MPDELTWMPAWKIRERMVKREISPVEVTEHFLGRVEEYDGKLKSFAYLDRKGAREQAARAEKAILDGDEVGLLHGIPMSVKGHFYVKGMPLFDMGTMEDLPSAWRDEVQVERLRAAGAIIFGTNTLMGSGGDRKKSPTDPGPRYNWDVEARSAWDQSVVPGWSSSGTATATAARLVPIGLGSDGGGSTRLPAAYSGLVGVVATPGRIPWIHPASPAIELTASTGPLCLDVVDAALAAQAMSGPDGRDVFALRDEPDNYLGTIDDGVEGMRFAWSDDLGYASKYALEESARVITTIREAAFGFSRLGATVEPTDERWDDFFPGFQMMNRVFGSGGRGTGPKPTDQEYWASMEIRGRNIDTLNRVFRDYDVLLTPTSQLLARKVEDWDAAWTGRDGVEYPYGTFAGNYVSHVQIFNWLAVPAFSIPCGFVDGLPVGLQIIGRPGSDAKMFRVARAFQSAFPRDERPPL